MKPVFPIVVGVVVLLIALFSIAYFSSSNPATVSSNLGTVSGSVTYPSEGFPDGLTVCAENLANSKTVCTGPFSNANQGGQGFIAGDQFTYGLGYQLSVVGGTYNIYAMESGFPVQAYYSNYVPCAVTQDQTGETCEDHTPINVQVTANQNVTGIDPGDWYAPVE